MKAESSKAEASTNELRVAMHDVVRFVRQLSHDLRNNLNAAELQSAFLNEMAKDAEMKGEVQRLRGMLSSMGGNLQRLTTALAEIKLSEMPYKAADLVEDLQTKVAAQFPEPSADVVWKVNVADAMLQVDPQLLQEAILELFANAFQHDRGEGKIEVTATVEANEFTVSLSEPKKSFTAPTESWGREPFGKVQHGHYALGLARARSIIEAHHGQFSARHDSTSSSLISTLVLPVAPNA